MTTEKYNAKGHMLVLSSALLVLVLTFFVVPPAGLQRLAVEDGLVENLSAVNWLLGAVVLFVLFSKKKNAWLLLLAAFFVLCLGEEISWGQRLFGFASPEVIQENNFQGEFNLHNLNFFERRYGEKNAWEIMYDLGRIFAIFWFSYGCVLPVLMKFSSKIRSFVHTIRLPVMPLSVGLFFLLNYAVFQYFEDFHPSVCAHFGFAERADYDSLPVELREWYDSFAFLVFALLLYTRNRNTAAQPEPAAASAA